LPVVLLEDIAALIGLVLALAGVVAAVVTGDGVWDGVGTVLIGVLLVVVAIVLGIEVKSLLVGEGASPADTVAIRSAAESAAGVRRIIHMKSLYLGPDELLVGMKIAVQPNASASTVAQTIDDVERRVRAAVGTARVLYIEPDIDTGTDSAAGSTTGSATGSAAASSGEAGGATPASALGAGGDRA
jgi:divalent metal cation (Fe/Co/Zn/Cd) transporter